MARIFPNKEESSTLSVYWKIRVRENPHFEICCIVNVNSSGILITYTFDKGRNIYLAVNFAGGGGG